MGQIDQTLPHPALKTLDRLVGNDITIWLGQKGSDNRFKGTFSDDGNSYSGAWEWPGGGYKAILTRAK